MTTTLEQRQIEGAKRYALAERSDPFALNRALLHIRQGLCAFDQFGRDCHYNAEPISVEKKLPNGDSYHVTEYRNMVRP
jgi:hypothetical protein